MKFMSVSALMALPNMDGRVGREDEVLPDWPPLVPTPGLWTYKLHQMPEIYRDIKFVQALKDGSIDPVLLGWDRTVGDFVIEGNHRIV
jgi:hypothetical protein